MSDSPMTYEQAKEQAIKLHKQGMTYPKIEEHLRTAGYRSSRTKGPVGALAIRHMVTSADRKNKQEIKRDEQEDRIIEVRTSGFRDTVRKLSEVALDETTFLNLMKALVAQEEKSASASS